ncbi:MAG: hypothetical protein NC408_06920 [Candidatus Gastranaerophilales bacterium]|nr:hypothetical protein [Candidatus Gastranaerophilales bacterium]
MADFDNLSGINENFDTIKTLLNSIRAQGILNTSDVDKLLSGINSKLEKINTEEDIDLIKIFLSELKQNLDERHSVLISKFGAIESLFSNLLKNSSEMPKSAELKELFDIVATNLSVFSREVVSQKESLTDITLRLDALRSDDSQKRDIIKNISLLKTDLERLNNGFDSIVLSLNDNFKTIIKTIASFDKTDYFDRFADVLTGMEMSSNTILSAVQVLDKKTEQIETVLQNLATQDDITAAKERLFDLSAQSHELTAAVGDLSNRYIKIDNLAEKIDASVDIIASLKSVLEDADNQNTHTILDRLNVLEVELRTISTDTKFEEFKVALESALKNILDETLGLESAISQKGTDITTEVNLAIQKLATLQDANITRVLNDISTSADALNSKLAQTQSSIATLCEKNFGSVFENISNVKKLIAQIDENSVSANNAIFASITDRLALFENSLKVSLETQEKNVSASSLRLLEQVENIKNLSGVLDYKMDSTVVEAGNVKRELSSLKDAVEAVLALDFVNTVKDLRVDLYASKQELMNTVENTNHELSDKVTNDLYGKYELLISKLDSVEDEFKKTQTESLASLKGILENISSSIVDVLSYVGEQRIASDSGFNGKLDEISTVVRETSLNYVESIREVIDVIRISVENSLKNMEDNTAASLDSVKKSISENSEDLKKDIKYSYSKLLEIQDSYKEIKEMLSINSINSSDRFDGIIATAEGVKTDFESQIISLKGSLLDKISEFKQEFTCANADKVSELKFAVENLYSKNAQEVSELLTDVRDLLGSFSTEDNNSRAATLAKILDNFVALKSFISSMNDKTANDVKHQVDVILADFANVKAILDKLDENVDGDMTRQLSIIESNFESLVSQITILFDKSDRALTDKINDEFAKISLQMQESVSEKLEAYKLKIEETFDKLQNRSIEQSSYLQNRIADLNTAMKSVWEEQSENNYKQIEEMTAILKAVLDENIKLTAVDYVSFKEKLGEFAKNIETNNNVLTQDLKAQLDDITKYIDSVLDIQAQEIETRYDEINAKSSELLGYQNKLSVKFTDLEGKQDKLSAEAAKNTADITAKLSSNHAETLKTMAELSVVTAEQLEDIKTETVNAIDEMQSLSKNQFDILQATHDSITNTVNDLNTKAEKRWEVLNQNAESALSKQMEFAQAANNAEIQALNEIKTVADEHLNYSRIAQTDTLQAIDNVQALTEESLGTLEDTKADIASLTQICVTNNSLVSKSEELATERHQEVQIQTDSILNTAKNIEGIVNKSEELASERHDNVIQQAENILNSVKNIEVTYSTKNDLASLAKVVADNKALLGHLDTSLTNSVTALNALTAEISAGELQTLDSYVNHLLEQIEDAKQNVKVCKDLIIEFTKNELDAISKNIEKETDIIIGDLVEQFDLLRQSQADDIIVLASKVEEIVSAQVYDNIEDLKSYLDIKTDNSVLSEKLDNLKSDMMTSVDDIIANVNTMLTSSAFSSEINDFRLAVELTVSNAADTLNSKISEFISQNTDKVEEKLAVFDKKFIDTLVDKYEEIKLISNQSQESFQAVQSSLNDILSRFSEVKESTNSKIEMLTESVENANNSTTRELHILNEAFENLRSQISNKSFDEAFQASINKQIGGLEELICEQMGYIEDISDLCGMNLPEVAELNTIVKHSVLESLNDLQTKFDLQDIEGTLENELKQFKTDIVTQFLNVFNQISFVTEQEEILDFVHEKHEELITILSHIVTTTAEIETVKENVAIVDNKIDNLKEDIDLINEKITAIISAEGDIDYVYSLQDLESDIANLRIELNSMKENDHGQEFQDLIKSTNDIYKLVESIKTELPNKRDFEGIAEDIVSISTRTNKLILASDESYKTLQDNLQDFKLVINDLDERTKNFAQESGMDKVNAKLNAINSMMEKGAKTNQVFNQVFEYLAEWVDNASVQINSITDRVETLGEIGQIKDMLADLKAGAEDNTETVELIEALGAVFDKQTKRISSLEAKLDKIIVETTINNRNNKLDLTPMEDTLNRFLVAMDEKMTSQQAKIDSLEAKLAGALELLDGKETAQLTKKVGGMDRQIAKLNKSIEKIASHVVER